MPHKELIHVEKYDVKWKSPISITINVYEKADIGFVKFDIKNAYFDKDGIVSEITSEKKQGIPEVRGIYIGEPKKGKKFSVAKNKNYFDAILNITSKLRDYNLPISLLELKPDNTIIVYLSNIIVTLGDIKNMEIKLQRLNDIYPQIKDLSGSLDLSNASDNMIDEKYIFKKTA